MESLIDAIRTRMIGEEPIAVFLRVIMAIM